MASRKTYEKRAARAKRSYDPRRTPAPPDKRVSGSRTNRPGSATVSGTVQLSDRTMQWLKKQAKEYRDLGILYITAQTLAKVYRRGAGAYSKSHYPGMTRDGWARARVSAFLEILTFGKPANPRYVQDNDLLPYDHPLSTRS